MSREGPEAVHPAPFILPATEFNNIADGLESPEAAELFGEAAFKERLLFTRLIASHTTSDMPPPLEASRRYALEVLAETGQQAPGVLKHLMMEPHVPAWQLHTHRRAAGGVTLADSTPVWVDAGRVQIMAAVGAMRAGLEVDIPVPIDRGAAVLPTEGCAVFPDVSGWEVGRLRTASGAATLTLGRQGVEIPSDHSDLPRWLPYWTLTARSGSAALSLTLNDLDKFRGYTELMPPSPAGRLKQSAVDAWQELLPDAWDLLVTDHPARAAEITRLRDLIPVPRMPTQYSASHPDHIRSVKLSLPDNPEALAEALVHENEHGRLNSLLHHVRLVRLGSEIGRFRGRAPWRDDPRPADGLLHGIYAFGGVTEFLRTRQMLGDGPDANRAAFKFALLRDGIGSVLQILRSNSALTELGLEFVERFARRADGWWEEPVPSHITDLTEAAAQDLRAQWLAHHGRPDSEALAATVEACVNKQPSPIDPDKVLVKLRPDRKARRLDSRSLLMQLLLGDPKDFAALQNSKALTERFPNASKADLAYVAGDYQTARQDYLEQLAQAPDNPTALVGLALTELAIDPTNKAVEALLRWPHMTRVLQQELAGILDQSEVPPPLQLAAWLEKGHQRLVGSKQASKSDAASPTSLRESKPGKKMRRPFRPIGSLAAGQTVRPDQSYTGPTSSSEGAHSVPAGDFHPTGPDGSLGDWFELE